MSSEFYQIASEPVIKNKKNPPEKPFEYSENEKKEKEYVDLILQKKDEYAEARKAKEKEWTESYRMYMSQIDTTRNPFLSNLFIPKTHEAVELLSAFLIGTNQSIKTAPENNGDSYKAQASGKLLEFLWRKELKARLKVLTWIKQGVVFGNGVLKVGWNPDTNKPFMANTSIEDVYFDYYVPNIQDSPFIIHVIRKNLKSVQDDERYDEAVRNKLIVGDDQVWSDVALKFNTNDKSLTEAIAKDKVVLLEAWNTQTHTICTLAPTQEGWRIAREVSKEDNIHFYDDGKGKKIYFAPFAKLRFKTSPLANRAYDMGAVYPTVKIQKAFNDLVNQYFDNVVQINNSMWIKRRGARINPMELVRRPGGVITVGDIDKDIRADVPADIKTSMIEMLNRLDNEYQQASMVVNLLKGIGGGAEFATEAQLGQQNVQQLLDMIDENINDALSEVGDMILALTLQNSEGNHTIKMFENDAQIGVLEFDPKNLVGRYDVKISADRSAGSSKVVRQKQLLDFIGILSKDPDFTARYPNVKRKAYEKWLEEAGFSDTQFFFDEATGLKTDGIKPAQPALPGGGPAMPGVDKLLTEGANIQSATAVPSLKA